ncbi:MAG TPA: hypothetical protein PKI54_13835, partial [Bacteroidia bacterium]|nr:hypothetical protein [Bacteroidia bacterium]
KNLKSLSVRGVSHSIAYNVLRLCVRLRSVGLCVGQLAQNRCYKLAAVYYTETLIEALKKRIKKKKGWK